jgi:quercetin dioxygenase-like cupin family protein
VREVAAKTFHIEKELNMATQVTEQMGAKEIIAFGSGRQSLERSVWYTGWLTTFLATGKETRGQFALLEQVTRKGNVPPPHIHHKEDETFYVLEGEMTFSVGDQTIRATPGTMVFLPRDVVHSFTIDSEQVRLLVLLAPAGLEDFFKELSVPAPSMTLPPPAEIPYSEIQKMMALAPKFGFEIVLPKH